MLKRIFTLLLILVFVIGLSGCTKDTKEINGDNSKVISKNEDNKKNIADIKMGRYMEKNIEFPELGNNEHMMKIIMNAHKQFELYTQSSTDAVISCYSLQKDMTWEKSTPGWLNNNELKKLQLQLNDLALGEDGYYYACFQSNYDGYKTKIVRASADGKDAKLLDLSYLNEVVKNVKGNDYYPMIQEFGILKSGNIVINDAWSPDKLIIITPEGKKIDTVDIANTDVFQNFLTVGNDIIVMNKENKIITYNTEDKKVEMTQEYEGKSSQKAYAVKDDGTILMGDAAGIHRLPKNATIWETTVDGTLCSMSMPSLIFNSLYVLDGSEQEEYYSVYRDENTGFQLKHYVFDKSVSSVPANEITVYSLTENKTIRQAISLYQAKNADVKINYIVAMGEEGGNVSDYIRALNTELLSGKGADILLLDGLPIDSYIEKGVLADLTDVVKKNSKNLLTNVINSYKDDGRTYRIPIRFGIPIILGNQDAVKASDNLTDLIAYIQKSGKQYTDTTTYNQLLTNYLALYLDDVYTEGKLDQTKLKEFLEDMKVISDNCKATEVSDDNFGIRNPNGSMVFGSDDLFQGNILSISKCETAHIQLKNVFDFMVPNELMKSKKLAFTTIRQTFVPKGLVGLNKASKEFDIAKEFIDFLFTSEVQDTNLYDGFPVNMPSINKWVNEEDPGVNVALSDADGNMISANWPAKEDRDALREKVESVNKPIEINKILNDMILQSASSYLSGESDIDQVTTEIMSKANTYLAE